MNTNSQTNLSLNSTRKSRIKTTTQLSETSTKISVITPSPLNNKTRTRFRSRISASYFTTAATTTTTTSPKGLSKEMNSRSSSRKTTNVNVGTTTPAPNTTIASRIQRGNRGTKKSGTTNKNKKDDDLQDENYPEHFKNIIKSKKINNDIILVMAQTMSIPEQFLSTTEKYFPSVAKNSISIASTSASSNIKRGRSSTFKYTTTTPIQETLATIQTRNTYFPTKTTISDNNVDETFILIDESPKYTKNNVIRKSSKYQRRPKSTRSTILEKSVKTAVTAKPIHVSILFNLNLSFA